MTSVILTTIKYFSPGFIRMFPESDNMTDGVFCGEIKESIT
ncbi:hypothetical protein CCP3SC1AL1_110003 [Gammaproteobacteria bacterium]